MEWDTSDPDLVILEYHDKDYTLVRNSRSKAILTALTLRNNFFKATERVDYCKTNSIRYLINTYDDRLKMQKAILSQIENLRSRLTSHPTPETAYTLYRIFNAIDETITQ